MRNDSFLASYLASLLLSSAAWLPAQTAAVEIAPGLGFSAEAITPYRGDHAAAKLVIAQEIAHLR